jgi:hypothetical protein
MWVPLENLWVPQGNCSPWLVLCVHRWKSSDERTVMFVHNWKIFVGQWLLVVHHRKSVVERTSVMCPTVENMCLTTLATVTLFCVFFRLFCGA